LKEEFMNSPNVKEPVEVFKKACGCTGPCGCHLKKELRDVAHNAGEKLRDICDTATCESRNSIAVARKKIRNNPLAASAMAAGVGFILAALLRRK